MYQDKMLLLLGMSVAHVMGTGLNHLLNTFSLIAFLKTYFIQKKRIGRGIQRDNALSRICPLIALGV